MYYKLKSNIMFRVYDSFGYISDNRNFRYKQTNDSENFIGDKIVSMSGAVFLSALGRKPQTLDIVANQVIKQFKNVDLSVIKDDVKDFFSILEQDEFIVSGETKEECEKKDSGFSYKTAIPMNNETEIGFLRTVKDTQDFFEEHFEGKPQLTNVHMEIISRCNERCIHCYIPHESKINYLDTDVCYDILKQCREMNVLHVTLSGGEPMLHKDFCNILKKCREYNFSVNVLSNLTLLSDDVIKEMKSNALLGVQVSLYSMNPQIHDEITQLSGSFEKTKLAILKLIENDIPLQISCPIMKQNKKCYSEVKKWAESHNINVGSDYVIIGACDSTTNNLGCRLAIEELEEIISDGIQDEKIYFDQIEKDIESKRKELPSDFVCSVCHSSLCISETGNAYPCAGWQGYQLGNIKVVSLSEIWNSSPKVSYLRSLRKKDFPQCLQCSEKDFCTMCMVRNANEHPEGNPLVVNDYFCKAAEINKQVYEKKRAIWRN